MEAEARQEMIEERDNPDELDPDEETIAGNATDSTADAEAVKENGGSDEVISGSRAPDGAGTSHVGLLSD